MSRVGKVPVPVPAGVKVHVTDGHVRVEGPKGVLERQLRPDVQVAVEPNRVVVTRRADSREARSLHGLARVLIENIGDKTIEPQRALFLVIPPTAAEDDRQAFLGGAGGVLEFDRVVFEQVLERLHGGKKISREVSAHFALLQKRQLSEAGAKVVCGELLQ